MIQLHSCLALCLTFSCQGSFRCWARLQPGQVRGALCAGAVSHSAFCSKNCTWASLSLGEQTLNTLLMQIPEGAAARVAPDQTTCEPHLRFKAMTGPRPSLHQDAGCGPRPRVQTAETESAAGLPGLRAETCFAHLRWDQVIHRPGQRLSSFLTTRLSLRKNRNH